MCLGSYNLDKVGSRESKNGTINQMANKGPREEAKGQWKRFGEQVGKGKGGGQRGGQ